jgi:HK97 family phage major capsid protein
MNTAKLKEQVQKGLREMKEIEERNAGVKWSPEDAKTFDRLADELSDAQEHLDRAKRREEIERGARAVERTPLPGEGKAKESPEDVVGYLSLGEAFTNSREFKNFAAQGFPAAREIVTPFAGSFFQGKAGVIPVTRKQLEQKDITVGDGVIRATRDGDTVRFAERDRLMIRDLLNVSRTDSNSVEYVTLESATRAAAPVADGDLKPQSALEFGSATAPVRTIAVTIPVTEQQLQDVPQIQNTIDTELTWDLKKAEEEQLVWGDGTGQNLLGIFETPGVEAGREETGDTIIDIVRRSMTDVIMAGLEPNGTVMSPLDWEQALLTKGGDEHYIWAVVTDENGHRLWGTRVVETVAMHAPGTAERRILTGDFRRGATLWDRQQAGMQIGWVNDQFRRNQRTIRVEERLAFGVKRPAAFRYHVTNTAGA